MLKNLNSGIFLVILSALAYSLITVILSLISSSLEWSNYQVLFVRFLIAGTICCIYCYRSILKISKDQLKLLSVLSIFYVLTSIFLYIDINKSGASSATAMLFSSPIFIIAFKSLQDKRLSLYLSATALLTTLGCILVNYSQSFELSFYSFLSPLCYSLYIWFSGKMNLSGDLKETGILLLNSALLLLVFNFSSITKEDYSLLSMHQFSLIIVVSLLSIFSILFFLKGVTKIGATRSSIIATTEPIFAVILASLVLEQYSTPLQFTGVILIIISNILIITKKTT